MGGCGCSIESGTNSIASLATRQGGWFFGNHQIRGLDYNDTYASVGKVDSLRILLALAVAKKLSVVQFDVVTAFLNGDMQDVVY